MAKNTKVQNVGMVGALPSMIALPGGNSIPTDMLNTVENDAFARVAGALGFVPKGLFYAIQYGLSQSLQDSVAGMAKALRDEGKSDAEIETELKSAMAERLAAIANGEIGHRARGPQVRGVEKILRDVAWEAIVAAASAKGIAGRLPKKASEIAGLVDKYLSDETRANAAHAEAERRMNVVGDASDVLDDIAA